MNANHWHAFCALCRTSALRALPISAALTFYTALTRYFYWPVPPWLPPRLLGIFCAKYLEWFLVCLAAALLRRAWRTLRGL